MKFISFLLLSAKKKEKKNMRRKQYELKNHSEGKKPKNNI